METKHTKGEWSAKQLELSSNWIINSEKSNICTLNSQHPIEILEANAKLIAAAPELLEALKVCYNSLCTYGSHPIIENQVEKTIEKATK